MATLSIMPAVWAAFALWTNPPEGSAVISTYEMPAIAGLWEVAVPTENGVCYERYNFAQDGKLRTTSAQEITTGSYAFMYPEDLTELPIIATTTEQDNNAADCAGEQIDQTGDGFAAFVRLDNKHSPTVMTWCSDAEGENCPTVFKRILP
ncbi:hypothetical protein B0181_04905 [Moraxella caviae]|uniref:Uncharacterized protein n=1 Tax=Moraxella caviae TaxID=34060 RepID=A0A1T0A3E5_9GAMM|nr:hypothetical protein [Moraxella caviae]OOR90215.1 hypothetical protein B0181_04905 [Moraxella caviae]STZ14565.1 Uncharacterised protein [Moraxella caviae]VEW12570.1 Uncharacterised protein [Moraxella caviae]